jgi:hypothetical protein
VSWPVTRRLPENFASAFSGGFRSGRNRRQIERDGRQIARPTVKANAAQLRRHARALQIRLSAQMDISAEHAGADQGNFDFSFHWVLKGHTG